MSKFKREIAEEAVKFLANLIFKKNIQKQKGIMKILPGDKVDAEKKAKFALKKLQERGNINVDKLTQSDLEFIAEDIANPFKYAEKTPIKSADVIPFKFKRTFAEELADASKKGDFTRMKGIMQLDPKFKEVIKAFKKSKADEEAYKKMVGPKKLIPDRDVIPYQSPPVQSLNFAEKLKRAGLTEKEYMDYVVKRGYGVDDAIYARDFYGDTTEDIIRRAAEKGTPVAFADGGVAGLLGERTGYIHGGITHSDGRRGFFTGAQAATRGPAGGQAMSPGTSTTGGTRHGGGSGSGSGGSGGTTTIIPKSKPKSKPKRKISLTSGLSPTINFIKKFIDHDRFTDMMKVSKTPNYHQMGGLDYMMRFPGVNPNIAKGLATGYQYVTEGARALTDSNKNFSDAMSKAAEEARLNAIGIDAFSNPDSATYKQYTDPSFLLSPATVQMASGGRIGFSKGKLANLARRNFMKLLGGVGVGIGALKTGAFKLLGKKAAPVAKEVITTPAAAGKPAWFDALVTRVINEGDDVTKKFATKEREIVHLKKIDEDATVTVTRDLDDGTVRVDIDDPFTNVADEQGNAIVSMEVRGGQLEQGVKGKTPAEFQAVETDYGNYLDRGGDDYTTEVVENVVKDTKDLTADLTKVKMYAKGQKKPTIKEMMIQRERAKNLKLAEENPVEYASGRQPDIDYASGGLAHMVGE